MAPKSGNLASDGSIESNYVTKIRRRPGTPGKGNLHLGPVSCRCCPTKTVPAWHMYGENQDEPSAYCTCTKSPGGERASSEFAGSQLGDGFPWHGAGCCIPHVTPRGRLNMVRFAPHSAV